MIWCILKNCFPYVLVFLGGTWPEGSGEGTVDMKRELKGLTWVGTRGIQCATGYPVPVPVPANPANIFQSGSGSGSGQILAGLAGFLKIIQKFSKMLKM